MLGPRRVTEGSDGKRVWRRMGHTRPIAWMRLWGEVDLLSKQSHWASRLWSINISFLLIVTSTPWKQKQSQNAFVVLSLSCVPLFVTPWTGAGQVPLSSYISWSLPKLMSIELVMLYNHLILCCPLLHLPSIFPSIVVFSNESALCISWPKYQSFNFRVSPSNEYSGWFPLGLTGLISLQSKGLSRVFSSTTVQKHQFFGAQLSLWSNFHVRTWLLKKNIALTIRTFVSKVISLFLNIL